MVIDALSVHSLVRPQLPCGAGRPSTLRGTAPRLDLALPTGGSRQNESKEPKSTQLDLGHRRSRAIETPSENVLRMGNQVEARYKGGTKWYKGKIVSVNRDGTYDIRYEDGDEEKQVKGDMVRRISASSEARADGTLTPRLRHDVISPRTRLRHTSDDDVVPRKETKKGAPFEEGDKVEARFRVGKKWFVGKITSVNKNGTYDVRYEDGDKEAGVDASNVRRPGSEGADGDGKATKKGASFEEGEKVEARFRGGKKWFAGKITSVNKDGTYDVRYGDGDKEAGVDASNVRRPGSEGADGDGKATKKGASFEEGEKVEARFRGGKKWFAGKITSVNKDGTYDVRYEDGDKEAGVDASNVRRPGSEGADGDGKATKKGASFEEGEKVEARFRGGKKWFAGKITSVNKDGTYDVRYEDGDKEAGVDASNVRRPGSEGADGDGKATKKGASFEEGDKVEARFRGGKKWFAGKITSVNKDGTYDVRYEDGDEEAGVDASNVRRPGSEGADGDGKATKKGASFEEGEKVEARFRGGKKWFAGKITSVNKDGTYDVRYEDGDKEAGVDASNVRRPGSEGADGDGKATKKGASFEEGEKVEARFRSGKKWFAGKITSVNKDGTYDVRYEDGDKEAGVDASNVRRPGSEGADGAGKATKKGASFEEGEKVEARFRGGKKWFAGKITSVNKDGTYDVRYEDGDKEAGVDASNVRRPGSEGADGGGKATKKGASFEEGEKVEARFRGGKKWFAGKITSVNKDGTYDVRYEDGDKEAGVDASNVRRPGSEGADGDGKATKKGASFEEGDKVEARFRGGKKWFVGKITSVNKDGTYDVRYEDGDKEAGVDASNVRRPGSEGADGGGKATKKGASFEEGEKVEARFRGGKKWFAGKITSVNKDGTYDVRYEDGDKEAGVDASNVRRPGSEGADGDGKATKKGASFEEGEKVEARFRGGKKWFAGKITSVNKDGTYDVRYEDGDKEAGVDASNVRRPGSEGADGDGKATKKGASFEEGDKVEARFRGGKKWFAGKITSVNKDGTYDVRYEDGDKEAGVDASNVRRPGSEGADGAGKATKKGASFEEGDKVEVRFRGGKKWFAGKITSVNKDGTYDVRYEDGDKEAGVDASNVRRPGSEGADGDGKATKKGASFEEGEKVEARFRGGKKWFAGKITSVNKDGTYDVRYEDGDKEAGVDASNVRRPGSEGADGDGKATKKGASFEEGEKVEARFRGGKKWFAGKITSVNKDGTYDVRYEDGDKEAGVDASNVRRPGSEGADGDGKATKKGASFEEGDKVEVRFRGGKKWFAGKITSVNKDGTYDVRYEDGDKEAGVDASNVRRPGSEGADGDGKATKKGASFEEGDKVEARFRGGKKWFAGKITSVNKDGTYDVRYEDGDKEAGVDASNVRRPGSEGADGDGKATKKGASFEEGEKVEARFRGGKKWFAGKITSVNKDGTYDVRYEDGDKEAGVDASNVRRPGSEGADGDGKATKKGASFEEGEKVEARFRGGKKWFAGKITSVNKDGTYDVRYEDGDKEAGVDASNVRRPGSEGADGDGKATRKGASFEEGEKVEARFRGGKKWFAGKITSVNKDGTYDVRYEDGDKEAGVDASNVRRPGSEGADGDGKATKKGASFEEGEKVEARFRGGKKWFAGKITSVNKDGTYDVRYEDGDKEAGVDASNVRRPGSEGADGDGKATKKGASFEEGDKVEARFRGGKKWFAGKITSVNKDGTYDVRYEDGDKEAGVDASNVRRPGSEGTDGDGKATKKEASFEEGEKVEARFRGGKKWFAGKITSVNKDGTYDVRYEDGDKEAGVDASNVRRPGSEGADGDGKATKKGASFEEGEKVEARFRGGKKWFAGKITSVNKDGTYDVRYGDGDKEAGVDASNVRRPGSEGADGDGKATKKGASFEEGEKVEARFRGGKKWFAGKITSVNKDGTYDVRYEDGDKEAGVDASNVRRPGSEGADGDGKATKKGASFEEGEKVEARFRGGKKWFAGKITSVNKDGTYDVRYEDGDKEAGVDASNVRRPGSEGADGDGKATKKGASFEEGEKVEARFRGGKKWFVGKITSVNKDGTYDVRYGDGDKEAGVDASNVRRPGSEGADGDGKATKKGASFEEGEKVEARFRGGKKWFAGKITSVNKDGTYDVRYEDGDKEAGVDASNVRRPGSEGADGDGKATKKGASFEEGEKVEARFRGGKKWFAGKITSVNKDGTYDVRYEDGDKEAGVDASNVRRPGSEGADGDGKATKKGASFEEGDKVEARFRGGKKWFAGKITSVNKDGTYDVRYEDGDKEADVDASNVRRPGSEGADGDGKATKKGASFEEGEKVEARFRGGKKWFAGKITSVNKDGTYDVRYEDGDKEAGVDASNVRRPGSEGADGDGKATKKGASFEEGEKVEVRFRGGKKWFVGKITSVNKDGTYDVRYEDGDKEAGVDASNVRRPGSEGADGDGKATKKGASFEEGEKVEARFRGGKKWFAGKITSVNKDGTYDLRYEDGDKEAGVDASCVRPPASGDAGGNGIGKKSNKSRPFEESKVSVPEKSSSSVDTYSKGDKVEAQARGENSWKEGTVMQVHADRTYTVQLRSGETLEELGLLRLRPLKSGEESKSSREPRQAHRSEAKSDQSNRFYTTVTDARHLELWGTDGLLPRKLLRKLVPIVGSMHDFDIVLRGLYEKDDADSGFISEADLQDVLKQLKLDLDDDELSVIWRVFDFEDEKKLRYWDLLELLLGECEGEDLAEIHVKIQHALLHAKAAARKVHVDMLSHFQKHDRRSRGSVPIAVLEKAFASLGVPLDKLERRILSFRFAGPKPDSVDYEPLIFWAAAGIDVRKVKRKLRHAFGLLAAEGVSLAHLFDACDPSGKDHVSVADFERIIRSYGVPLSTGDLRILELRFKGRRDMVKYQEMVKMLQLADIKVSSQPAGAPDRVKSPQRPKKERQCSPKPEAGEKKRVDVALTVTATVEKPGPVAPPGLGPPKVNAGKMWSFDLNGLTSAIRAAAKKADGKTNPTLWQLLRVKDQASTGSVTRYDFVEACQALGFSPTDEQLTVMCHSYDVYADGEISIDEFLQFAYEGVQGVEHLYTAPLHKSIRNFLRRNQAATETFNTIKDLLLAADAEEKGRLPVPEFLRTLHRMSNMGLTKDQCDLVSSYFACDPASMPPGADTLGPQQGQTQLSSPSSKPEEVGPKEAAETTAAPEVERRKSAFPLSLGLSIKTPKLDPASASAAKNAAAGAPADPAAGKGKLIDYAEFLLWIDRNCMDDVGQRSLVVFKAIIEARVKEEVAVAAALRALVPVDQVISSDTFYQFATRMGLLLCRPSVDLLFEALTGGADSISVTKLVKLVLPGSVSDKAGKRRMDTLRLQATTQVQTGVGATEASARLDAELKAKISKAMEKAFKHFDTDHSNTIDVEEFVEVLRALGQDLSSKEVKAILKKASRSSEVMHFEEFERAVYPFLRERIAQSTKISESMLKTTFQAIDRDGGGNLSREEVKYAFVDQLKLLTQNEAEALVSALDRNKDDVISWDEFRRVFYMIQEPTARHTLDLERLGQDAKLALKKLHIGMIPDPENYLSSFVGMPSNVRKSVLVEVEQDPKHSLDEVLRPVVTVEHGGLTVKDMPVKIVPVIDPNPSAAKRKKPECRAVLQPLGTRDQQQRGETSILQIKVSMKQASGIPVPDDDRAPDILRRNLRACLFLENPKKPRNSKFIGNVYVTMAKQDSNREERWHFPENEYSDPSFIVRLDLKKLPGDADAIRDNMYLLLELTMTMSSDPDVLTRTNKLYYHSDEEEGKNGRRRGKKGDRRRGGRDRHDRKEQETDDDDEQQDHRRMRKEKKLRDASPKKSPRGLSLGFPRRKKFTPHDGDDEDEHDGGKRRDNYDSQSEGSADGGKAGDSDEDRNVRGKMRERRFLGMTKKRPAIVKAKAPVDPQQHDSLRNEVTLSCGWCKMSLLDLATLDSERRFDEPLSGGTPFVGDAIKTSEVRTRRYGWRAMVQALIGTDARSHLEFVAMPVPRLASDLQTDILLLPPTMLVATTNVSLIRTYREILAASVHREPDSNGAAVAPGRSGAYSDPVLALFPKIMADPAMRCVLHSNWQRALKAMSMAQRADNAYCCNAFSSTVLQMWPAYSIYSARPPVASVEMETLEAVRERTKVIAHVTKNATPFKEVTVISNLAKTASSFLQTQAPPPPQKQGGAPATAEESQLYLAFHTKEISFNVENDF